MASWMGRFGLVQVGLGRLGSCKSNSDYEAISASQQSWSFGLAELGKIDNNIFIINYIIPLQYLWLTFPTNPVTANHTSSTANQISENQEIRSQKWNMRKRNTKSTN